MNTNSSKISRYQDSMTCAQFLHWTCKWPHFSYLNINDRHIIWLQSLSRRNYFAINTVTQPIGFLLFVSLSLRLSFWVWESGNLQGSVMCDSARWSISFHHLAGECARMCVHKVWRGKVECWSPSFTCSVCECINQAERAATDILYTH